MGTWDVGSGWRRLGTLSLAGALLPGTAVGAGASSSTITACVQNVRGDSGGSGDAGASGAAYQMVPGGQWELAASAPAPGFDFQFKTWVVPS